MSAYLFFKPLQVLGWAGKGVLAAGLVSMMSVAASAQEASPAEDTEPSPASEVRRIDQITDNDFSIEAADQLTEEATLAISNQQFPSAIEKLTEARTIYNDLSTNYQELAAMFVGIDTRQNNSNRTRALDTAQKRDQVTYQLALLYRSQNRPEDAIPLLMDILRSQQPTRELGQQAYQQLFEMGFVEEPYQR